MIPLPLPSRAFPLLPALRCNHCLLLPSNCCAVHYCVYDWLCHFRLSASCPVVTFFTGSLCVSVIMLTHTLRVCVSTPEACCVSWWHVNVHMHLWYLRDIISERTISLFFTLYLLLMDPVSILPLVVSLLLPSFVLSSSSSCVLLLLPCPFLLVTCRVCRCNVDEDEWLFSPLCILCNWRSYLSVSSECITQIAWLLPLAYAYSDEGTLAKKKKMIERMCVCVCGVEREGEGERKEYPFTLEHLMRHLMQMQSSSSSSTCICMK